jgi:hypothetical protein
MTVGPDKDSHPILICVKCRGPMEYLALLPEIANLPAIYAYRCFPCRRVDTVASRQTTRQLAPLVHTHDGQ